MHVHGREQGDVQEHGDEDEQGKAETCIQTVWKMDTQDVLFVSILDSNQLTQ